MRYFSAKHPKPRKVKLTMPETAWERLWMAKHKLHRVRGKTLEQMPGVDTDHKKLNWFLWRRGLLEDDGRVPFNRWTNRPPIKNEGLI